MAKKPKTNREKYVDLVSKIKGRYRDIEKRGYIPIKNVFKEEPPKQVLKRHIQKLENIVKNITLDEVFSFYKTCIKEKQKALVVYGSKIPKKMITTIKKNWSCYNE